MVIEVATQKLKFKRILSIMFSTGNTPNKLTLDNDCVSSIQRGVVTHEFGL
jgi:hypothetical protein